MDFDYKVFDDENITNYENLKDKIKKYDSVVNKQQHNNIIKSHSYCYDCNIDSPYEDHKNGVVSCSKCGLKIMQLIDTKNIFTGDVETMQNYININKYLPQLSCSISIKGMKSSAIVKTLHKWYNIPYDQTALNEKYILIQEICTKYKLLKCVEDTAKILYTQIYYEKYDKGKNPIFRGNNYLGLIATCIWYSAMKYGINLYLKELADMCNIKTIYIKKGEKIFNKLCKLKQFEIFEVVFSCENYISRFCDILNINNYYKKIAIKISNNIVKIKIFNSQQHVSIAVGIIYTICVNYHLEITKEIIANTFKISQGTILKTYKKIKPFIKILLDESLTLQLVEQITTYQNKILYHKNYIIQSIKFKSYPNLDILHFNDIEDIFNFYVDVDIVLKLEYHKLITFYLYF